MYLTPIVMRISRNRENSESGNFDPEIAIGYDYG